jgi:glutamyl-tRNA synthetase
LPLILKPIGKGKLSKRDGDKMGFPVFPLQWTDPQTGELSSGYREAGYFPEAFVNMLALLGWNPGTEQEIFSMDELIEAFSLERVGKSGSKFDPEKTKWFNHQYMMQSADEDLAKLFHVFLLQKGKTVDMKYVIKVVGMLKERATFVVDIWEQGKYFFETPDSYDEKTVKKRWNSEAAQMMENIHGFLQGYTDLWEAPVIKEKFSAYVTNMGWGFGAVMNAFRLCIVGAPMGADLFDICEMIGADETLKRIRKAIDTL